MNPAYSGRINFGVEESDAQFNFVFVGENELKLLLRLQPVG